MEFRILGRLQALDGDRDVAPGRAQPRALLALFLLHPNQRLSTDRLIEALWSDEPPATADKALQGHISMLRKALGTSRIATEPGAYRLEVRPGELDADRFAECLATARMTGDPEARARLLGDALDLWRGEPLGEFVNERFAQGEIERLEELRLAVIEARAEVSLELGQHAGVASDLESLVTRNPLHEGLRAKLMLALYRSGRQSDALRVFREGRKVLAQELGIDPGNELQLLERRILEQDPTLAAPLRTTKTNAGRAARQERKIVTVLVAEVVPTNVADPEDLDALVGPAVERVRAIVERHGGTAEPLFANAVLGLFGAPRAHDDDSVRAVRAALELRNFDGFTNVRVRAGIESGEALVTIDAADRVAVTGSVLAAASTLQSRAAAGAIVVGPGVRRSTEPMIAYDDLGGDAWLARTTRASNEREITEAPFIGRTAELELLERIVGRAREERSVQLVTMTAEPGGGKSRLVRELRARLERAVDPPRWRQGRCLPYGDGITYWALGEIVKAQAGILESDDADTSRGKLRAAVAAVEPDDWRRTWLDGSLAALVGLESSTATGDREQAFAAWLQFLEGVAAPGLLVLVFEDVHWADAALLELIEHIVRHASGVALVVLCTSRLELLAAHPAWGAGIRNATSIALPPLSASDTERLLRELLGHDPDADTVRRAGGNPLFAHELAWIGRQAAGNEQAPLPDSLQSLIAARLDTLSPELKAVASDAAVVGEIFWSGALAATGGIDLREVETGLQRLVESDVIRRRRTSSVGREAEYEFLHVLVRDVAYGQIPRRDRITKHAAVAAWIETLAGDRPTSHAELIAHHYLEALGLAQRLGDDLQAGSLRPKARDFLALAGDGARPLDVAQAERLYQRALGLSDADDPHRGQLLARLGEITQFTGRLDDAEQLIRAAIVDLESHGDSAGAAAARVTLVWILWRLGRSEDERRLVLLEAIRMLEGTEGGSELILAYSQMATLELYAGRAPECLDWSSKAVRLADRLGAAVLKSEPFHLMGIARFEMGDLGGIEDVRSAVQLGREAGLGWQTCTAMTNLAATLWLSESPAAGLAAKRDAAAFAVERGLTYLEKTTRAESLWLQFDAGDWDAVVESADDLVEWERERGSGRITMIALGVMARVLIERGDTSGAVALEAELLQRARTMGDSQDIVPALSTAAAIRLAVGDGDAALQLVAELAQQTRDRDPSKRAHNLPLTTRVAVALGAADLARSIVPSHQPNYLRSRLCIAASEAILAEAAGDLRTASDDYRAAADGWSAYGDPDEQAYALIGAGRCLAMLGNAGEARRCVAEGRALAEVLRAQPLLDEAARLEAMLEV